MPHCLKSNKICELNLSDNKVVKENRNWTIIKTLSWTESYFEKQSIDSPRLTAEILLSHSLNLKRLDLYLQHDRPLNKSELSAFTSLIKRRVQKEPVAYITGEKGFYESDFIISDKVLIPRPDTELLVEETIALLNRNQANRNQASEGQLSVSQSTRKTILELGTGSGAIVVSICKAVPEHEYFALDISLDALETAKKNGRLLAKNKVQFLASDWFSGLKKNPLFDFIISNPPYIPLADIDGLQPEIKNYEPLGALNGGTDGLDCYRLILDQARFYLVPGGVLVLEIGYDQKIGITQIIEQFTEYDSIEFKTDLAGHDRVVVVKKTID